jgi:hypothetical protein
LPRSFGASAAVREQGVDGRQHLRHHQRRRGALRDAGGDELPRRLRHSAQRRGQREAGDADEEHALASVDIAQPPSGDQAEGEGQRVSRHHPLHRRVGGIEFALDGWQGDVDDRVVEQVHEECEQDHHQREPPLPARGGGREVRRRG